MSVLSVDLGTSNTVAVLSALDRPPRVVEVEGTSTMPSAVFAAEDGQLIVGREAERRARLAPARYEPNPKRRVDEGTLLLGDSVVPVSSALAAVLSKMSTEVGRQLNGARPDEVRLTRPAQWGAARQNILVTAARQAGLGNPQLVPEPVAAAAHFAAVTGHPSGQALAVYDLGAGTFDVAVVSGKTVLAEGGLPDLGGLDVDQALLDHIGRQVSAQDPAGWQRLLLPQSTADRRAARALREDVRAAKESLSAHPQTEVPLPEPFGDVLVTRAELEGLIRPGLLRSVEVLATTVESAGTALNKLAGIYLVGGSSRIPLVATLIAERLGVLPVNLDQPETAVALGAHHVGEDGVSLRTRDLPPQLAETRTAAIAPPQPGATRSGDRGAPPAPGVHATGEHRQFSAPQPSYPQGQLTPGAPSGLGQRVPGASARPPLATHPGNAMPAGGQFPAPPMGAPAPGPHGPVSYPPPWAPTAQKSARQQLRTVGGVVLCIVAGLLAILPLTALTAVPVMFGAVRLLGSRPDPLGFLCYGYAILLAAHGIFWTVMSAANELNGSWVRGTIIGMMVGAVLLAFVPLSVRAMREGKHPPATR